MTRREESGADTPKKHVTVTINGKKYRADEGETLLSVAIREKIDIPHLCYEASLEPTVRSGSAWSRLLGRKRTR